MRGDYDGGTMGGYDGGMMGGMMGGSYDGGYDGVWTCLALTWGCSRLSRRGERAMVMVWGHIKSSQAKSSHLKSQARPNHVKLSRQLKPSPTLSLSLGLILALSSGESERAHTCACTRMVCMHMHAHLEEREQHACRPRVAKSLEARHLHHHTQSPTTGRT